ncbi:MAG TPA: (d)CMP kinase [Chthoniobacterales bacterium]|nr:(d)CMP kinase [Chthoniobacterales bacterium]
MQTSCHWVVTIDGPAASGKSSVARELARRLRFVYVNSGAIYRAITWYVLRQGVPASDSARIAQLVGAAAIDCQLENNESRVVIGAIDPTPHLREPSVNDAVSQVSTVSAVRHIVTEKVRGYAREHDLVVEGRDIGSVVFPDTPFKFYIDASPDVRLRRRAAEGQRDEIAARDWVDSSRRSAPLTIAPNAHVIDSSELSVTDVVDEIVRRLRETNLPI